MWMTLALACSMAGKWGADTGSAPEPVEETDADTDADTDTDAVGDLHDDCDDVVDERAPTLGDLVITEIMKNPDPTDDETGEWFEIVNAAGVPIALDGLVVTDTGGTGFTMLTDAILAPDAVYLLGVSADAALNGGITPDHVYAVDDLRLDNGADALVLTFGGVLVDAVAYDDDFPDDSGKSLSLDPDAYSAEANDEPDHWCEGDGEYGADGNEGTPGEANGACP